MCDHSSLWQTNELVLNFLFSIHIKHTVYFIMVVKKKEKNINVPRQSDNKHLHFRAHHLKMLNPFLGENNQHHFHQLYYLTGVSFKGSPIHVLF